ncbi:alkaline phosphatase PhoX, partial [Moraxella sp.]|uniref:alkaline phosphatase PhoX n=1 Tax=Moraxella sp. TaxID=479 RepID=UPI0026100135
FRWDIYLFASPHDKAEQNLSKLTAENDLSSPDGLFFDPRGVLWIQTDDGAYTKTTNCMLLAALPNKIGDGEAISTTTGKMTHIGATATPDTLKRFFVGPAGSEVTGITMTPDFKALFINIQHPEGAFGAVAGGKTPRSGTVVITKKDGGVILGESLDA